MPAFCVQAAPGTALHFNGTNSCVSVPHNATLNAYPLTITAWVRTLRNASEVDGIVCKYFDGSFNGYSIHLYNGHVYAFFLRSGGTVFPTSLGIDGGTIADGNWHHIAFVITPLTGYLYVDGNLGNSANWSGTAGPVTGTEPLQIGRYYNYPYAFQGDIDEVTLWNRALSASEVNYLKHRSLGGQEDGLLGYWRFDEGFGIVANNTATNTFNGSLSNSPAWVPSQAAIALQPIATNCLKFDGVNGYVQVAHNADLDSYPFTATAWFRTTNTLNAFQGIVSKYVNSSGNGWCILMQNGLLRGFFYRQVTNRAIDFTYATPVTDGAWHHVAMTVDASGGKLWLDGVQVGSGTWVASPGGTTGIDPLLIGRFDTVAARFNGVIDEVSIWNRALTAGEISTNRNLPLVGNEPNLVAYWRLDEGAGATTTADATIYGHTGTLISNPAWTGSTAYLGDGSVHLVAAPGIPSFSRTYAVNTAIGIIPALSKNSFQLIARAFLRRFNDFGPVPPALPMVVLHDGGLQISGSATPVTVQPNTVSNSFSLTSYNASSPQPIFFGGIATVSATLNLQPSGGNLDSINNLYQGIDTLSHSENGGAFSTDATSISDSARLLHFNGHVIFGGVDTIVTNIANTPAPGTLAAPSYIQSQLQFAAGGAYLASAPSFVFGGGAAFNVNLGTDGTATNVNGSFSLADPNQFFSTAGIRYKLQGAALNASGMVASNLQAWFPTGLGMTTNTDVRTLQPFANLANVAIGPDLLPTVSTVNFTAASYGVGSLSFAHEIVPLLISAPRIQWLVPQGRFTIDAPSTLQFTRQQDDDVLLANQAALVQPSDVIRVSNDGLYRNPSVVPGVPVDIFADANGAARLSLQASLNPPELRPHFPYAGRAAGAQIPTGGGSLVITDNLVTADSVLNVTGPLPVSYGRDCTYVGCTAAQAGPATLSFTTTAGQLNFTPDGGLLAYGSVPSANLMWGYTPSGNFAQQASTVGSGAFCMAGTFLRADQTVLADSQRAAVILFSGFGDASNPAYFERPSAAGYNDGFANYPGLNFRSPTQGASYVGQANIGPYPLDPVSKYYVRFGGVNGIHQSATAPGAVPLYGYQFTFSDFGFSYLDGQNWESVTTGAIQFPLQPAGFRQEFDRMKVTCRGDLSSANIPAGIGSKHLAYWGVDFTPQSLDFHPTNDDTCGTSPRFLVLGVETKLPFIPQALHASLGFKPSGNLVCPQDNVSNVDSRFQVPAQLSLQGPGSTLFTLSTANEGYFNNWETAGAPALGTGFYNLSGKLRVPFFSDVKVHLHITPSGSTDAQVDIMGGWSSPDSTATDLGWSVNKSNFFNMVKFDPHNDGWPGGNITDYRNSGTTTYRPRAQRDWIEVAFFDYPLKWDSSLHRFAGFQDATVKLPIIDVNSRLKELAPGKVDFDFSQDLNLQLPRVKVLDFVNDALNGNIGPLVTVSNAIREKLVAALDVTGINSLSKALREDAQGLFNPILGAAIDPVLDATIFPQLAGLQQTNIPLFLQQVYNAINTPGGALQGGIQSINNLSNQASSVVLTLDKTLGDVLDTAGLLDRAIARDPSSGNRKIVATIVEKLIVDQGVPLGFLGSVGDDIVNPLLADIDPTLTEIQDDLETVSNQVADVKSQLDSTTGEFNEALGSALQDAGQLSTFLTAAAVNVTNYLASVVTPSGDLLTANPAAVKQAIRQQIITAFLSSALQGNYQQTIRQFLGDNDFALNQIMNTLFDQINSTVRDSLENQIMGAQDGVLQKMKGAGFLSGSLASAKIRGAPVFNGDSLRDIHLNAAIQLNIPDKMNFNAYMDIKELDSQSAPVACIPAGAPAAEVTIGAKRVPLNWAGVTSGDSAQSLTLDLEARWTLQGGNVIGIGGQIDIGGTASMEGCQLKDIGAALAIGQTENYFAAKVDATVPVLGIPVNVKAGIFAGQACSLDPLKYIDPEVDQVLLNNPATFSGVYVQYGGGLSLSDLLGLGGLGCVLNADATVSSAYYWQNGKSLGTIGGRQKMGVDISLICLLSGHLDYAQFLALDTSGSLTVGGTADVCGSIGPCPFCLKGCKGITIKGVVSTHGVDYFVDY